jgi:hypothetical protein
MWTLSRKNFSLLEILGHERHKASRKKIVTEISPYEPTDGILKVLEAMHDIAGL